VPQQENIGLDFSTSFNQSKVSPLCSAIFTARPADLPGNVVNWERVDVMAVFAESLMNFLIQGVKFITRAVVVEITCVDDT
jgi:hypothetical protein